MGGLFCSPNLLLGLVLIGAVALGIGNKTEPPFFSGIAGFLQGCSATDEQLKVEKVGVVEGIHVVTLAVEFEGETSRNEFGQKRVPLHTRVHTSAGEVIGATRSYNVGMRRQTVLLW